MTSKVEICNLALGMVRSDSINSLTESSRAAQVCNQWYDTSVRFLLEDFPWGFAHKTAALGLLVYEPREWVYAYAWPSDCAAARYLLPNFSVASDRTLFYRDGYEYILDQALRRTIPWERGLTDSNARAIFTDQPDAYVAYTANIADPNLFEQAFVMSLAWYLAGNIAVPLAGEQTGRQLRKDALDMYATFYPAAKATSSNHRNQRSRPESPTTDARLS